MGNKAPGEQVLASATGSDGGLGKVGTLLASGVMYVRLDNAGFGSTDLVSWRAKCDKAHSIQLYRSRSRVDSATVTLSGVADGETGPILNGLTYTAEDTAGSAAWATRYFYTGGANPTADAVQLAKVINADYAVTTAGTSVAATDKLVITTDEGAHTIVAAAAADLPAGKYGLSATVGTELTSIVAAINHKDTITAGFDGTSVTAVAATDTAKGYALAIELIADHNTHTALTSFHAVATAAASSTASTTEATLIAQTNACRAAMLDHYDDALAHGIPDSTNYTLVQRTVPATTEATAWVALNIMLTAHNAHIATAAVLAGDEIMINGLVYTAGAATVTATRTFDVSAADGDAEMGELEACVDDATYGAGVDISSANTSGALALDRITSKPITVNLNVNQKHAHIPLVFTPSGGVPGVAAVETGATGELGITPVWTKVLTVTESGTKLTVVDIDCPGVYAVPAIAVVTLTPGTPGHPVGEEKASVIHVKTGTGAGHVACATTTLASLVADGAPYTGLALNSTTAGTLYEQWVDGWPYAYLGITNNDAANPATITVAATRN